MKTLDNMLDEIVTLNKLLWSGQMTADEHRAKVANISADMRRLRSEPDPIPADDDPIVDLPTTRTAPANTPDIREEGTLPVWLSDLSHGEVVTDDYEEIVEIVG